MLNLTKRRIKLKLSQLQIAQELKISVRMYQFLESGKRKPSWNTQQRLEQFFGIPASELLAESEEETN